MVIRRPIDGQELELFEEGRRCDLHISTSMRTMAQSSDGVRAVLRVEIAASRYGIFSAVRRIARTHRERVVLEVVVPHQFDHATKILDLGVISGKDECTRRLVVAEPVTVFFYQCR